MDLRSISLLFFISFINIAISQDEIILPEEKKSLNIERAEQAPKIDGVLDDVAWQNAEVATNFISFRPEIGETRPHEERTEIKMTYDNQAIYVAAYLYDDPTKIMKQLTI